MFIRKKLSINYYLVSCLKTVVKYCCELCIFTTIVLLIIQLISSLDVCFYHDKDGTKFDLYSKFQIFVPFPQFNSKICSYINKYRLNILLHVLRRKIDPGQSLTVGFNCENGIYIYIKTPRIYYIHILTLGYKINH